MSLELPVTYLQTLQVPQLPLSTAGLPSQATGASQMPLTVQAVAHLFLVFEFDRPPPQSRTPGAPSPPDDGALNSVKRKRVLIVVDPIASYTKDLDVAVGRCVAASAVTALRFRNEASLYGLRTQLHPLDILASHSSAADCIRVIPSVISWYRACSNVVAAQDNAQGWKPVYSRAGANPPLPATFRLQHEMPSECAWYVNPLFPLDAPDDPEIAAQQWLGVAANASPPRRGAGVEPSSASVPRGQYTLTSSHDTSTTGSAGGWAGGRPPLSGGAGFSAGAGAGGGGGADASPLSTSQDIAWLLPHAKRDGGASERAAASMLTLERARGDMAATQLEAVRTSLEAEKAALRSQRVAADAESAVLKKRVGDLDRELRSLRIERVATADSVTQLHAALNESQRAVGDYAARQPSPGEMRPEPLMVSRPETLGPIPTSLQNVGPSDAEVLAALMLTQSLAPPSSSSLLGGYSRGADSSAQRFSDALASPLSRRDTAAAHGSAARVPGRREPLTPSRRVASAGRRASSDDDGSRAPPPPIVVGTRLSLDGPLQKPAWTGILGTPDDRSLRGGSSHASNSSNTALVRSLLVKNSLPSPMQQLPKTSHSGASSRSATPDNTPLDGSGRNPYGAPTASSANRQQRLPTPRGGSAATPVAARTASADSRHGSAARGVRASSPLMHGDSSRVVATSASLQSLAGYIKAGRRLLEDLRS